MVNPVSDTSNRITIPINDSPKHKDLSREKGGSPQTNVSLSEEAQELTMFENDNLLTKVLKKEFNEVFEFGGDKKDLFLKKLDFIFMNSRL